MSTSSTLMFRGGISQARDEVRSLKTELQDLQREADTTVERLDAAYDISMALLSLTTRMGLPSDVRAQIRQLTALIMVYRQLYASAQLFYAASGPVGWAMFAITATSTAVTIGNLKMAE